MTNIKTSGQLTGYQAAHEGSAFYLNKGAGYVRLSGESRQDYLQRQTSNDIRLLSSTRTLPTVLPTPAGRILDVFRIVETASDSYALLCPEGRGPILAKYFRERIFFNDLVEIEDHSEKWTQFEIFVPKAGETLNKFFGSQKDLVFDEVAEGSLDGMPIQMIAKNGTRSSLTYQIIAPKETEKSIEKGLVARGVQRLNSEEAEILRIEAGLPGPPEFSSDFTPFEVGLEALVSDSKGCFTGQEVLARQVSYDKITRRFVRLKAETSFGSEREVYVAGKVVGQITSRADSPKYGHLALAVMKRPHNELGTEVQVKNKEASLTAIVEALHLTATLA